MKELSPERIRHTEQRQKALELAAWRVNRTALDAPSIKVHLEEGSRGKRKYHVTHEVPIQPYLTHTEKLRSREQALSRNKKAEYMQYASLDPVTVMNIKSKFGVDAANLRHATNDFKAMRFIVQTEYPKLLTTNSKMYRRQYGGSLRKVYANIPRECL